MGFFVGAFLVQTAKMQPVLLGGALHEKGGAALGTSLGNGFVPDREGARRIAVTPIKDLPPPGPAGNKLAIASFLGTPDTRGLGFRLGLSLQGTGVLAGRVSRAGPGAGRKPDAKCQSRRLGC